MSTQTETKVKPIPDGMHSITPHLICRNASDAIEFYKKAFNATETARLETPDGKIMHGAVIIRGSMVMLFDEMPEWGALSPLSLNGTPVSIHLYVDDVDAAFEQAVQAGATVQMPLEDTFWGDRYGKVLDPFGHEWSLATHIKDLTDEEIKEAAAAAFAGGGCQEKKD